MTDLQRAAADPAALARLGVPPDVFGDVFGEVFGEVFGNGGGGFGEDAPAPLPCPLLLTSSEVEVLLCFALTSPLHYGPVEEGLCDKLQRHLRGAYRFRAAPAG